MVEAISMDSPEMEKKEWICIDPLLFKNATGFFLENHAMAESVSISYDKNGWITKIEDGNGPAWIMTYDKQGYMLTDGEEGRDAMEGRANTYKNGRLVRQAAVDENGEEYAGAYTYKYKKITVPASAVKKAKRQQEWLTDKGGLHFLPLAAF